MTPLFTFVFVTNVAISSVPGLTEAECAWMAKSAPLVVAQMSREGGRPLSLIVARCAPEPSEERD